MTLVIRLTSTLVALCVYGLVALMISGDPPPGLGTVDAILWQRARTNAQGITGFAAFILIIVLWSPYWEPRVRAVLDYVWEKGD